ncbi:hypothetical protein C942_01537 [Photobacterium marinum]|uniref:N-acylglucosamine 2-epimerase n=2 Tax=Photobacterium marinum TaxID=1056511 RepID=L8JJJ7_9GAMM|nr:hypothetical protein C942_01537 [Photobacterium marinum]
MNVNYPKQMLALGLSLWIGGSATVMAQQVTGVQVSVEQPSAAYPLPTGERWLEHASQGLAPYWMMDTAKGAPIGNFPTFRCDDGSLPDVKQPCRELDQGWIRSNFDRDYTRMKSRQVYAYGVLYHMTGDPEALKLAKAGVDYLLSELRDREHGGMISFRQDGKAGLKWQQRTSQDQAYAIVGLAFYYYLTRDPDVEKALIEQQAFIFDKYRDKATNQLLWVIEDGDEQYRTQQELVAQLDQINAYLLLVTPLLPEPYQKKWRDDLTWLTREMVQQFHSKDEQRFFGAIHHPAVKMPDARHNDYGHTIKAYWMTYLVGRYLNQPDWAKLGKEGMNITLERAAYGIQNDQAKSLLSEGLYSQWKDLQEIPTWRSGKYSWYISSWQWAELDQAAYTLNMLKPGTKNKQLYYTLNQYFDVWVDHQYGGVGMNPKSTKQFQWGNGYHQFEHALVGYLGSQAAYNKEARLYYALPFDYNGKLQPYYFYGERTKIEEGKQLEGFGGLHKVAVNYQNIRP